MREDASPRTVHESRAGGQGAYRTTQAVEHAACVVCGSDNPAGLGLEFLPRGKGTVSASFSCHHALQGYTGLLHGGIIAALLDGAMTNCLFSLGISAVTAELSVRYLAPVTVDRPAEITATLEKSRGPLHYLHAELRQNDRVLAHASGKFMNKRRARCNQAERSDP